MLLHFVFYNSMNHHHRHFIFYLSKITFRLILQNFNYPKNEYLVLIQIILCVFSQDLNLSFFINQACTLFIIILIQELRRDFSHGFCLNI